MRMRWLAVLTVILALWPDEVLAVQVHGPPEGYLTHMMAHIFFSASLVFFLYILHTRPPGTGASWRNLKISLLLFLIWNVDTFTTHWLSHRLPHDAIVEGVNLFEDFLSGPVDLKRIIYYLGRFDHLICVPAMWYLMNALALFYEEARKETPGEDGGAR